MARELRSAPEIQAEVHRILHEMQEVKEDKVGIGVPHPTLLAVPDENGCNWTMTWFRNARGHEQACVAAMQQVQSKWNMGK